MSPNVVMLTKMVKKNISSDQLTSVGVILLVYPLRYEFSSSPQYHRHKNGDCFLVTMKSQAQRIRMGTRKRPEKSHPPQKNLLPRKETTKQNSNRISFVMFSAVKVTFHIAYRTKFSSPMKNVVPFVQRKILSDEISSSFCLFFFLVTFFMRRANQKKKTDLQFFLKFQVSIFHRHCI